MKKFKSFLTAAGIILILLLVAIGAQYISDHHATYSFKTADPIVSAAAVPDGWYAHDLLIENPDYVLEQRVLTREKELPEVRAIDGNPYGEAVYITQLKETHVPEEFVELQGLAGPSAEALGIEGRWGIYKGHKIFTISLEIGLAVEVFGSDTVYGFTLSPDLPENRADFWKVITYYVQNSSFPMLSRAETQRACETVTLPGGQEYDIQADAETGYVVVGYHEDGKERHAYFNYQDDIELCTSNVQNVLENAKAYAVASSS